jgi:hypothetical protein
MKKLMVMCVMLAVCIPDSFCEPRGWGLGLGTFEGDFGIHARKDFKMGAEQQYGMALQGGVYNQNKWTTRLDADFHYIFMPRSVFRFYPLAGIDLAIQSKNNRTGFNLGLGSTVQLNDQTRFFLEAKQIFGEWDGFALTLGVYF